MELVDDATAITLAKALADLPPVHLSLSPVEAFGLIGNLQLALRHPENQQGFPAEFARLCIESLKQYFPPVARAIIERADEESPFYGRG